MQGEAAGCGAYVTELRRERSGEFEVADAWDLEALVERAEEAGLPRAPRPRSAPRQTDPGAAADAARE